MDSDEIAVIKQCGAANFGVTKTRDLLRLQNPSRDYDGDLLSRLLIKGFQDNFGTDPDALVKFQEQGDEIRKQGGIVCFFDGLRRQNLGCFQYEIFYEKIC